MRFLTDVRALLGFVGTSRRHLTGTGRLRLADVRAINSLLVAPAPMDREVAGNTYPIRTEDEARRVHFLRILCEAGGLVATAKGRLVCTPEGAAVAAGYLAPEEGRLFADWWWRGAWDILPRGIYAARGPEEDREWTADALHSPGEAETSLVEVGARFNRHFGPPAPVHPDLHVDMWAQAVLWTCLEPLGAFGGCAEITQHRRIEPFTSKGQ